MNIPVKPKSTSEGVNRSRDASGFNKWAESSRIASIFMLILGWFTIPVEVFLRYNFGQRWLTFRNYLLGMIVLLVFCGLQDASEYLGKYIRPVKEFFVGVSAEQNNYGFVSNGYDMAIFLWIYTLVGAVHLFRTWWRNQTNRPLHSYDNGTSILTPVAAYAIIPFLNAVAFPFLYLCKLTVPEEIRQTLRTPRLINDGAKFANTVLEPVLLFWAGCYTHGMISGFYFISCLAVLIHASWRETEKLHKVLDFRDSVIEAKAMMQLKEDIVNPNTPNLILHQAAVAINENPEVANYVSYQHPDIMSIIEEMNAEQLSA